MIQVARVVPDFGDIGSDQLGHAVVLLQVDGEIRLHLLRDLRQRFGVFLAVNSHTNHVGPGSDQITNLSHGCGNVMSMRGGHALHCDRISSADRDRTNTHRSSRITRQRS